MSPGTSARGRQGAPGRDRSEAAQGRREKRRLEAFSDGVFAIAVTLLVLDLRVPPRADLHDGYGLALALLQEWPAYAAYLLSFATILIMWVNHHVLLDYVQAVDHPFLFLNGALLMTITLVPFPTRLVAEYAAHPAFHVATAVYCGLFALVAVFFNAIWWYAARNTRLIGAVHETSAASVNRRYIFGPLIYLAALGVSFLSPGLSLLICAALALGYALPYRPAARRI